MDYRIEETLTHDYRVWLEPRHPNHPCASVPYNNGKLPSSDPPHEDWFDWWLMSRKQRKRIKINAMTRTITTSNEIGSLSTTFTPAPVSPFYTVDIPVKEKKMYNYNTNDPHANARDRLEIRLDDIYQTKRHAMQQSFGLVDDDAPASGKELVERIQSGHYIPQDASKFDAPHAYRYTIGGSALGAFRWRKPDLKEDHVGFKAAEEKLSLAKVHLADSIAIFEPAKALEELRKFEEKKFH